MPQTQPYTNAVTRPINAGRGAAALTGGRRSLMRLGSVEFLTRHKSGALVPGPMG